MLYITQFIYLKEGQENTFNEFEALAIPLLKKYNGRVVYRIRPTKEVFLSAEDELPYEIHLVSFDSENDFENFSKDKERNNFIHLKNISVKSILSLKDVK